MFVANAVSWQYLNETKKELVPKADLNSISLYQHLLVRPDRYKEFQKET